MAADDGDRTKRRGGFVPFALLSPGVLWLTLFFLVPMVTLLRTALSVKESRFDLDATFSWHWANFTDSISTYSSQFTRSFVYAGVATVLCIVIGYPVAYVIAVRGGRWRNLLLGLVVVPFFTSFLIRTLAWQTVLNDQGPVLSMLDSLELIGPLDTIGLVQDGRLLATSVAVIGGLTYNFLPFMLLPIYASLERLDLSLIEAAKDLYASARQAFLRVTLPRTMPGVVAGVLLTFIPAFGDYINAEFLGGANNTMLGNKIQSTYLEEGNYPEAAALSFLVMAAVLITVLVCIRIAGTEAFIGEEEPE